MHLPVVGEEVKGQKTAANAELARSAPRTAQSASAALFQHHRQHWVETLHCSSTTDRAEWNLTTTSAPRTALSFNPALVQHHGQLRVTQPHFPASRVVLTSAIHATGGDSLQTCRVQLLQARSLCGCQLHENLFHYPAGCRRSTRLDHGRWHHCTLMNHRPTFDLTAEHWDTTFIGVPSHLLHWGWGSGGSCWGCGRCLQLGCWCRSWLIAGEGWPGCPSLGSGCPALEENTAGTCT